MKFMKKHLRDLNRANGNLFDKVKRLKIELDRVPYSLGKDPANAILREEQMIYYDAYKKALEEEEQLLMQKDKVKWLKDGDQNSAYLHDTIKGRGSKN